MMTQRIFCILSVVLVLGDCTDAPKQTDPDACGCAKEIFKSGDQTPIYERCKALRVDSTFETHFILWSAALQAGKTDTAGMTLGTREGVPLVKPKDGTYSIVVGQDHIRWIATKANGKRHFGTLKAKSGQLIITEGELKGGEIVLDMTSIADEDMKEKPDSKTKLEQHLKSDEFFDTAKFPEARFVITSTIVEEGVSTVVGNLTIKGITKQGNATVAFIGGGDQAVVCSGKLVFDRSQFDVRYGSSTFFDNLGDDLIDNDVEINFSFLTSH